MADEDKGTAGVASDATKDGGKGPDSSTGADGAKVSDTPTDEEVVKDDTGKPLPWDQQPKWKAARAAERTLQKLMQVNDVDRPEELEELAKTGKLVSGKVDVTYLDEIIAKAETLTKYESYWAQQAEAKKRQDEEPDQTAARLDKENADLKKQLADRDSMEGNKRVLQEFEGVVITGIKSLLPDAPKEQAEFVAEFLGVGNPAVEVDITNKAAVAKVVKEGVRKFEKFKQQIIKDYLEGKENVPTVPRTEGGTQSGSGGIKNLRDARKIFQAHFKPSG